MSNKMNEQDRDKNIGRAYKNASNETTTSELDDSIMAMAQEEVEVQDAGDKSWWQRLRMPVSIAASLLVTVGIARFMVELGYYSPDSIASSENQVEVMAYAEEVSAEHAPMKPDAPTPSKHAELAAKAKESADAAQVSAARIAVEEKRIMSQRQEQERHEAEAEMQMVQKKSIEQKPVESEPSAIQSKAEDSALADFAQETSEVETIVVTGSRIKRTELETEAKDDANHLGTLKEGSGTGNQISAPAPVLSAEEWLEEIRLALEAEDLEAARAKWSDFKQYYPDYDVDKSLKDRLEAL
ncbi:hypothetical protein [Kangiella sediminilitoris]|uniref:Uncharacterized protein n=1 Tax=Kangiella sediminilitoris TaxID=1144748 RepID=A0A1B3BDC6_9GAMM|nr:hypothetical protein [Kangiella sediminilitoris]AOE50829.1 hypothetical protein KS2013_2124 [Kangiella sediminilitoris]